MITRIALTLLAALLLAMPVAAEGTTRLYKMFDRGTDLEAIHGVPIGAVHHWAWDDIETAPGVYNWAKIDAAHAAERVLGKPVMTQIIVSYSTSSRAGWPAYTPLDATPEHVYARGVPHKIMHGRRVGHIIEDAQGNQMAMPAYDNATWRRAYYDMIRAFAVRYDGQVDVVIMSVGLDGETQPAKHGWMTALRNDDRYAGIEYRWGQFVEQSIGVYGNAFIETTSLLNNAPGGAARGHRAAIIAAHHAEGKNVGLKHSGLQPDIDSYQGWGVDFHGNPTVGSWDPIITYSTTLPIALESAHWMSQENIYWSMFAALHYHPTWVDWHASWFDAIRRDDLHWFWPHVQARTPEDAPSAWVVLRDSEFPRSSWGPGGYMGKQGNWEYWLTQTNAGQTAQVLRAQMPAAKDAIESRQARRGTRFEFAIDPGFVADSYDVTLRYLDIGAGSITVGGQTAYRANTGVWQSATFRVSGQAFAVTASPEMILHRIDVTRRSPLDAITPTATPTHTYTPTATHTPTLTATATMTPTRTPVPATLTPTPMDVEMACWQTVLTLHYPDGRVQVIEGEIECMGGER